MIGPIFARNIYFMMIVVTDNVKETLTIIIRGNVYRNSACLLHEETFDRRRVYKKTCFSESLFKQMLTYCQDLQDKNI